MHICPLFKEAMGENAVYVQYNSIPENVPTSLTINYAQFNFYFYTTERASYST